jgi:hypothetical protein
MHVEKNVCESLLRTLLNMDGKIRDPYMHKLIQRKWELGQSCGSMTR